MSKLTQELMPKNINLQKSVTPVTLVTSALNGASSRHQCNTEAVTSVTKATKSNNLSGGVKQSRKHKKKSKKKKQKRDAGKVLGQNQMASAVVEALAGNLRHDTVNAKWYWRSENIYSAITVDQARRYVRTELEKLRPSFAHSYLSGVFNFCRDDLSLLQWSDEDSQIPLLNGILDLESKRLRDYTKSDYYRECLPILFDENATCPRTEKILKQLCGQDNAVYEFLIACLHSIVTRRAHKLQKYLELIGPGGTGKSTFIALCTQLVGEHNRAVTELKQLENNRFESASLYGKRLIVISDSSRHGGEVSTLKAITGGDPLRNEVKNRQQAQPFICNGFVVIAANEPIASKDYSTGLSRRRIPVSFNHVLTDSEKAKYPNGVEPIFASEMAGLLNLLLAQDSAEMLKRIKQPEESIAANHLRVELSTNTILQWANDWLIQCDSGKESFVGTRANSPLQYLYSSYCNFCEESGNHPVASTRFSNLLEDQLRSRGINTNRKRTNNGRIVTNLRLRAINDSEAKLLLPDTE